MTKENLLKENELKLVLRYIIPSMAGMVGMSMYIFADTFFIANGIGSVGLTALNIALPLFSIFTGTGLLIGIGGATIFSISKGSGDKEKEESTFYVALKIGIISSIIYTIIGLVFSEEIAYLLGASDQTIEMVNTYIRTIFYFIGPFIINNIFLAFIRNDGSPKLTMISMLVSTLGNIILDYVFIYIFNMGMFGAALATGFAPIVSILILSSHFLKDSNTLKIKKITVTMVRIKEIMKSGIASFITEMSSGAVIFFFNIVILKIVGDIGVAAYGIIANVALVAVSIFNGIGQGLQPLISVNFGAKKYKRLKNIIRDGLIIALGLGVIFYAVAVIFQVEITMIFNSENIKELTDITVRGIRIYFSALVIMGVNMTIAMILQSVSKTKESFVISIIRGFIGIILGLVTLPYIFGLDGVWFTVPLAEVITLVVSVVITFKYIKVYNN